ncbi:MAG: glycoside hydrolase family 31 protein [Anaerolineales bacterium]
MLSTAPHAEPVADWVIHEHHARVEFPSATLELALTANKLSVRWQSKINNPKSEIRMRLPLRGHWYGMGQLLHQLWPLNKVMLPEAPLLTSDNGPTGLSCILTPAWLSSTGIALLAHSAVSVGLNQPPSTYPTHLWDLGSTQAPFAERPWADPGGGAIGSAKGDGDGHLTLIGPDLSFDVLLGADVVSAFRLLTSALGKPAGTPPAELFARPTWTTWALYKTAISQDIVINFAREIIAHGYPRHVMEIDDKWQVFYGDYAFDPAKFPDARGMIDELHRLGFAVTAWVHPFIEPSAHEFAECAANGFLVRDVSDAPYSVLWWQGRGGLLDVSNPHALEWFFGRLRRLQAETGLDGFKFDAGEGIYFPTDALTHAALERNDYAHRYVNAIAQHYALCEVRSGWFNQRAPIFFRQWDKTTSWSHANGLRSVIPGVLSLTGYPFILPDMVGGNAYAETAEAELMIRWTQLNALLPAMQFSLPLVCDDEFLLGNDVLAAPVTHAGARSRDIYLPPGEWRDYWTGASFSGPVTLARFSAPLEVLPLFERMGSAT